MARGTIVLLGGRSEIGMAVVSRLAADRRVVLAARDCTHLAAERAILAAGGATEVHAVDFDADDTASHPDLVAGLIADHSPIETVVVAFGILGDAERARSDVNHALQITQTDYVAQVSVLTLLADQLQTQDSPATLIVFSSVAGVRVRRANYVYGATKAGLDGFASGLSDAMHDTSVRILLVRPGFVIGAMTAELMASGVKPAPLSRTADQVADAVVRALRRGRREVWVPAMLRPLSFGLRLLPRPVWRRLSR